MNAHSVDLHKNRGRVIAHVFYSELEKIARYGPTGEAVRSGLRAAEGLAGRDIAALHSAQPKKGILNLFSKDRVSARLKERGIRKQQKAQRSAAHSSYKSNYRKAMEDLSHGNAAEQQTARQWLSESGGGVAGKRKFTARASAEPSREGGGFYKSVGKGVVGLGALGGAGYLGKKHYDRKKMMADPYAAYGAPAY
tara:strand:- start:662 stop:1246 length:585 start_codon:yes stop_codon:yes gene_type:complete